jgi:hypothetical protein
MRSFLDGLMSMLRDPARVFVLLVALSACGGADRKFADRIADGGTGGAAGGDGSAPTGAGGQKDGSASDGKAGSGGGSLSDAKVDGPTDAGMVEDTGPPQPPPPPGKPGMSIVAGGTKMKSPKYQGVFAAGESPGGNGVSSSPNFKLRGGVVATTQPK